MLIECNVQQTIKCAINCQFFDWLVTWRKFWEWNTSTIRKSNGGSGLNLCCDQTVWIVVPYCTYVSIAGIIPNRESRVNLWVAFKSLIKRKYQSFFMVFGDDKTRSLVRIITISHDRTNAIIIIILRHGHFYWNRLQMEIPQKKTFVAIFGQTGRRSCPTEYTPSDQINIIIIVQLSLKF